MRIQNILFTLLLSVITMSSYGQNCSEYHLDKCRWADGSFFYSRQSKSALFTSGMTSEFSITVYGGEEYYISVKGDKNLGKIKIRIKEDNLRKTVLYDNTDYKFEDYFYFRNENTRNLIIEITTLGEKEFANSSDRYCLGVLIEFKTYQDPTIKTGF